MTPSSEVLYLPMTSPLLRAFASLVIGIALSSATALPAATTADVPIVIERPTTYRQFALSLAGAADGDALAVHLHVRETGVVNGWALKPGSRRPTHVEADLRGSGRELAGELRLGLPKKPSPVYNVKLTLAGERISGSYTGDGASGAIQGRVLTGEALREANPLRTPDACPQWRGPDNGSASAVPTEQPLIRAPDQARLLWSSEEKMPAAPTDSFKGLTGHVSGWSHVAIAEGRIYFSYEWGNPSDDEVDAQALEKAPWYLGKKAGIADEENCRIRAAIRADEVLVCIDAATGQTLWRTRFIKQTSGGRNQHDNQWGWFVPVVADGKVVFTGNTGHVMCCDAVTGELLWRNNLGKVHDRAQAALARSVAAKTWKAYGKIGDLAQPPVIAGGIIAVDDHVGHLVAFDLATGAERWRARGGGNTPLVWSHGGRDYIFLKKSLYDARDGRVLWTLDAAPSNKGVPSIGGDCLAFVRNHKLLCYKLSPKGANLVHTVELDKSTKMGYYNSHNLAVHRNRVYAIHQTPLPADWQGKADNGMRPWRFLCLDLVDGSVQRTAVISRSDWRSYGGGLLAAGDRLFYWRGDTPDMWIVDTDPANFAVLSPASEWQGPNKAHVGEAAIVDGRFFVRTRQEVVCYDLRVEE